MLFLIRPYGHFLACYAKLISHGRSALIILILMWRAALAAIPTFSNPPNKPLVYLEQSGLVSIKKRPRKQIRNLLFLCTGCFQPLPTPGAT